ncbi:MAG: hypothetical protein ACOC4L_02740 [Halanaerobium sp.]
MQNTVWIRPSSFNNWLVCDNKKNALDIFENIFEDLVEGSEEKFKQAIENTDLEVEHYDEMDLNKFDSVKCETINGYEEEIEFKLVTMSEQDLKSLGMFMGW